MGFFTGTSKGRAEVMESVIRKIKAGLALAGSDNPNESATAMRQAKKLMAQHGIG